MGIFNLFKKKKSKKTESVEERLAKRNGEIRKSIKLTKPNCGKFVTMKITKKNEVFSETKQREIKNEIKEIGRSLKAVVIITEDIIEIRCPNSEVAKKLRTLIRNN